MLKKIVATTLIASTLGIASFGAAQAGFHGHHRGWGGPAALGIGLGVLGVVAAASAIQAEPVVDEPVAVRRICSAQPRYNAYGEYVGAVRICRTVAY